MKICKIPVRAAVLACAATALLAGPALPAGLAAQAAPAGTEDAAQGMNLPPVERRANQLFDLLRDFDEAAVRDFVNTAMHADLRNVGPMDLHLQQLSMMSEALGDFQVDSIKVVSPDRAEFVLRAEDGMLYSMNVETSQAEPHLLAGVGFKEYNEDLQVPEFASLEDAAAHLERMAEHNAFAGVVLVEQRGKPRFVRAYGLADKAKKVPNTPATSFDLGSITKTMTAVAVMQLAQQGKIDLQAPMGRYLDGFPEDIASKVKVIDLLRMESGYGDYYARDFAGRRSEYTRIDDYLKLFRTFALEFEPGTQELYSNTGYVILGGIIEAASGMTYHDYVRKNIFAPLGMTASSFRDTRRQEPGQAIGYTNDGPTGEGFTDTNLDILDVRGNPSGGSYSSAADLLRFNQALWDNELLDEKNTTFLLNRFQDRPARPHLRGVAGGAPGVSSVSVEDREAGFTVIVLANQDEPIAERVGEQIYRMLAEPSDHSHATVATAPRAATEVPMRLIGSQPAVEVRIDGEGPFLFLIDTGAGDGGRVSQELARRFAMKKVGSVLAGDPSGRNAERRDVVQVASLELGGRVWTDVELLLAGGEREIDGIDGILGMAMFQELLLTLDYPGGVLRFGEGELPEPGRDGIIAYRPDQGIPLIELDVAGTKVDAHIDSGSMGWLMVPEKVARALPLAGEPTVVGHASTSFNEFDILSATLDGPLRVAGTEFPNPRLDFAGIFPVGNVGGRFLEQFAVTIDQRNQRLQLLRPAGSAGPAPRYRVGVMLAQDADGSLTVDSTLPGSPAARAGLLAGDRIVRINGSTLDALPPGTMAEVFGKPEEILLLVDRGGAEVEVKVRPEKAD